MSAEPKSCPTCDGYMHRCEPYKDPVYDMNAKPPVMTSPASGCMAQSAGLQFRHPAGDNWVCLFCDLIVPAEPVAS